ncbi:hypothetical protein I6G97_15410 [Edwardsiella hoshinae]|nr:hypothetical protein [Edwardsiella hoshinae]QPR27777.1 hypothetical protein I6G97_15410 [Edwardsiella hoshinae]
MRSHMQANRWLGGAILMIGACSAQANVTASATLPLSASFTAPSCTISVPAVVYLGSIPYGTKIYPPLTITLNCPASAKTEVYAQVIGPLVYNSIDTAELTGIDGWAQLFFSLNNVKIKLNGESNKVDSGFCLGIGSRTCSLLPVTWVDPRAREGERSAVIKFNIRYKA